MHHPWVYNKSEFSSAGCSGFYYDAHTAPMLVKVISLQFLPLLHHNYSFQSTNLYPEITVWLLDTKRASNGAARRQVAAYHLSLLQLLLCSTNTSLSHIGHVGKKYSLPILLQHSKSDSASTTSAWKRPGTECTWKQDPTPWWVSTDERWVQPDSPWKVAGHTTGTSGLDVPKIKIRHHKKYLVQPDSLEAGAGVSQPPLQLRGNRIYFSFLSFFSFFTLAIISFIINNNFWIF